MPCASACARTHVVVVVVVVVVVAVLVVVVVVVVVVDVVVVVVLQRQSLQFSRPAASEQRSPRSNHARQATGKASEYHGKG